MGSYLRFFFRKFISFYIPPFRTVETDPENILDEIQKAKERNRTISSTPFRFVTSFHVDPLFHAGGEAKNWEATTERRTAERVRRSILNGSEECRSEIEQSHCLEKKDEIPNLEQKSGRVVNNRRSGTSLWEEVSSPFYSVNTARKINTNLRRREEMTRSFSEGIDADCEAEEFDEADDEV